MKERGGGGGEIFHTEVNELQVVDTIDDLLVLESRSCWHKKRDKRQEAGAP